MAPLVILPLYTEPLVTPSGTNKGYFAGGAINFSEIDGIDFITESAINPSMVLSVARFGSTGVQSGFL